ASTFAILASDEIALAASSTYSPHTALPLHMAPIVAAIAPYSAASLGLFWKYSEYRFKSSAVRSLAQLATAWASLGQYNRDVATSPPVPTTSFTVFAVFARRARSISACSTPDSTPGLELDSVTHPVLDIVSLISRASRASASSPIVSSVQTPSLHVLLSMNAAFAAFLSTRSAVAAC